MQNQSESACLVVDDAPSIGHHAVVVPGKCMVASPEGTKGIAADMNRLSSYL